MPSTKQSRQRGGYRHGGERRRGQQPDVLPRGTALTERMSGFN